MPIVIAKPSADTFAGDYTTEVGGSASLFLSIDELTSDDADWVQSLANTGIFSDVYVTKLETVAAPSPGQSHTVSYRYSKDSGLGQGVDLTVELRQGYTDEGSQGTLIASWTHTDISDSFSQADQALTSPQIAAISDYASLYLRFVFAQNTSADLTVLDPQVMIRWSDDGGHTWSSEHWVRAGRIGEYTRRVTLRRIGRSIDRVYEIAVSDPILWRLINAYLDADMGAQDAAIATQVPNKLGNTGN